MSTVEEEQGNAVFAVYFEYTPFNQFFFTVINLITT